MDAKEMAAIVSYKKRYGDMDFEKIARFMCLRDGCPTNPRYVKEVADTLRVNHYLEVQGGAKPP